MKQARREKGESYIGIFIFHSNRKKKVGQVNLGNRFFFSVLNGKRKKKKKRGEREKFLKRGAETWFFLCKEKEENGFLKKYTLSMCVCV
jgi:hypothetical protein